MSIDNVDASQRRTAYVVEYLPLTHKVGDSKWLATLDQLVQFFSKIENTVRGFRFDELISEGPQIGPRKIAPNGSQMVRGSGNGSGMR